MKLGALVLLVFSTCAWLFEPIPPGEGWTPPAHYRAIWDSAQACTGKRGNFDRIVWYRMPGNNFPYKDGSAIASWTRPHAITIAVEWQTTDWVVKHEMIHDLLQMAHNAEDLREIWGKKCHATWGFQPLDSSYVP